MAPSCFQVQLELLGITLKPGMSPGLSGLWNNLSLSYSFHVFQLSAGWECSRSPALNAVIWWEFGGLPSIEKVNLQTPIKWQQNLIWIHLNSEASLLFYSCSRLERLGSSWKCWSRVWGRQLAHSSDTGKTIFVFVIYLETFVPWKIFRTHSKKPKKWKFKSKKSNLAS